MTEQEAKKQLIAVAISNLNYSETKDNIIKFAAGTWDNTFYGWELQGQPWCDLYVDYCFCDAFGVENGAAMTYQKIGRASAACRTSAQYYQNNNAWSTRPEVGDQIFFYSGGAINHTGIVETVNGNKITTIEGNSSDKVARRTYNISDSTIAGYGKPKWSVVKNLKATNKTFLTGTAVVLPIPITIDPVIKLGDINSRVKELQTNLIKLGYDCGPDGADGEFGKNTFKAVVKFQKDHQLEADGEAGKETLTAIKKALELQKKLSITKNDKVKIKSNATFFNSKTKIPQIFIKEFWTVDNVTNNQVTIKRTFGGTQVVLNPVDKKFLEK